MAMAPLTPQALWRRNIVCRVSDRFRHAVESGSPVDVVVRPRKRADTDRVGRSERERRRGFFPHPNRPGPAAGRECLRPVAGHARFRDRSLPRVRPGLPDPGDEPLVHSARWPGPSPTRSSSRATGLKPESRCLPRPRFRTSWRSALRIRTGSTSSATPRRARSTGSLTHTRPSDSGPTGVSETASRRSRLR